MDLAQFVSDYMAVSRSCGDQLPPRAALVTAIAQQAAEADHERTGAMTGDEFLAYAKTLEPSVDYLLPVRV